MGWEWEWETRDKSEGDGDAEGDTKTKTRTWTTTGQSLGSPHLHTAVHVGKVIRRRVEVLHMGCKAHEPVPGSRGRRSPLKHLHTTRHGVRQAPCAYGQDQWYAAQSHTHTPMITHLLCSGLAQAQKTGGIQTIVPA